jgi:hypothetical protein
MVGGKFGMYHELHTCKEVLDSAAMRMSTRFITAESPAVSYIGMLLIFV